MTTSPTVLSPTVLVIDDDAFLRITIALELPGISLLEATRLEEGWEIALEEVPDALLLDRWLPDGDGVDLIRRIRETAGLLDLPVLLVTAGFDEADRESVLSAGADEYLPKPISGDDLTPTLERILAATADERRSRRQASLHQVAAGGSMVPLPDPPPPVPVDRSWRSRFRRHRTHGSPGRARG